MVLGFEQAQAEYEYHLMNPYDKGGALYEEEEYDKDEEAYWLDLESYRRNYEDR